MNVRAGRKRRPCTDASRIADSAVGSGGGGVTSTVHRFQASTSCCAPTASARSSTRRCATGCIPASWTTSRSSRPLALSATPRPSGSSGRSSLANRPAVTTEAQSRRLPAWDACAGSGNGAFEGRWGPLRWRPRPPRFNTVSSSTIWPENQGAGEGSCGRRPRQRELVTVRSRLLTTTPDGL